ncbi:MAG: diguanylate cyclase [Frankiales bacterium]|nr:diguanylate cyclase [Frankiales bacterium]
MSNLRRPLSYLLIAVTVVAAVLVFAFQVQRRAAVTAARQTESAVAELTAMLDQETGMRGFLLNNGGEDFLAPYLSGQGAYAQARIEVGRDAAGDRTSMRLATAEEAAARAWQDLAADRIAARRRGSPDSQTTAAQAGLGKQLMDQFRSLNAQLRTRLDQRRDATLRLISTVSTIAVVGLATLFGLVGFLRLQRQTRRRLSRGETELAYRVRQREFSDLIQAVDSEEEAHQLVEHHLQRSLPGATATVLTRNNSDNRLQAATDLRADSALNQALAGCDPRACLAIRLGRAHQDGNEHEELISCKVCSHLPGSASCQPLLVAGKVIGSVLIQQPLRLNETDHRTVVDIIAQAAPVLANLKTLAIAENRAATDALTGLPNRRAMHDTLKRMAAHAGRSAQPLAAIAFDLDHFKTINDRHGHETGDAALSAVGECLRENLRGSDFAARIGGEEFLVLAPDTDLTGARLLAEKLREALTHEVIPHLLEPITASFGIAVIPDHAANFEMLLRRADRASYLAKERGRNRVETATDDDPTPAPAGVHQLRPVIRQPTR